MYGSAQWRYFGKLFVETGSSWRERIVADGEVVAIVNVSAAGFPSVDYRVSDNLGSTAAIVNADGTLEGRYAWDAWGDLVNPATGNGNDPYADADEALTTLGYSGHEMFWEAGLVHTQARLYDPSNERWLSPDPTVPNLYDGQSLNRYSYVLNNPMTYTDPNGYAEFTCTYTLITITIYLPGLPPITASFEIPHGCSSTGSSDPSKQGSNGAAGVSAGTSQPPPEQRSDQCPSNPTSASKIGTDEVKYTDANGNTATLSNGSRTWVTHNPGAVASGSGSIGSYRGGGATTAIFPDVATGAAAQHALWMTSSYQNLTVLGALNRWTGASFEGTSPYVRTALDAVNDATAGTAVNSLTESQQQALEEGQKTAEGWNPGTQTCSGG